MQEKWRKLLPWLFTLGGAVTGLAYYYGIGCAGGSCAITASPTRAAVYMAVVGWLVGQVFAKQPKPDSQNQDGGAQ